MRWTRWTKWDMWPLTYWGALRTRAPMMPQQCSTDHHGDHLHGEGASLPDTNWWSVLEDGEEWRWAGSSLRSFLFC
jgi:hypothetical protein